MLKNVDIKFNRFTYISAKSVVVIEENVEKCWFFLKFLSKNVEMLKNVDIKIYCFFYIN